MSRRKSALPNDNESDGASAYPMILYNRPYVVSKNERALKKVKIEPKRSVVHGVELQTEREMGDLLNEIIPPRCWIGVDGQLWKQIVSPMPATCQEVNHLLEKLDKRLHMAQARETGICHIRRAIYAECFNEVIRQETINCAERGLLLVRIRDEMEVTLAAYEVLYCSAIGYGVRKALESHIEKEVLSQQVESMETARDNIEEMLEDMKEKFEAEQSKAAESFAIAENRFHEEMAFLKKATAQAKAHMEAIMSTRR